jgi:phosphomannomutase
MREINALCAFESSGHTYYRDFWYADCGMIPVVQIFELLSTNNMKLSESFG